MIVTRHRKARPHPARFLVPLGAVAAIVAAFAWPPSHRAIANGPLAPVWSATASTGGVIARPLTFAGQQQTITDRNREIRDLDAQLERAREAKAEAEARVQHLQQQLATLANQPRETPAPAPRATTAPPLASVPNSGLSGPSAIARCDGGHHSAAASAASTTAGMIKRPG